MVPASITGIDQRRCKPWATLLARLRRDAEVEHDRIVFVGDHDVRALEIPVHNPVRMGVVERARNLYAIAQDLRGGAARGPRALANGRPETCSITMKANPPASSTL